MCLIFALALNSKFNSKNFLYLRTALGVGYRDEEACKGVTHSEPLGQSTRHFRQIPLLWLIPGSEGNNKIVYWLDIVSNLSWILHPPCYV